MKKHLDNNLKNKDMKKFKKVNCILMCIFLGIIMLSVIVQIILFIISDNYDLKSCICTALSIVILLLSAYGFTNYIFILKLDNIKIKIDEIEKMIKGISFNDEKIDK